MKLFKKTPATRTLFFILADIFLVAFSVWLAFFLRFDGAIPVQFVSFIYKMAALAAFFTIVIFYFSGLYSFSWSYVSTNELVSLFKSSTASFLLLAITLYVSSYFPRFVNFPRSTIFISYVLSFILCGGLRLSKRIYLRTKGFGAAGSGRKTLIIGAGDAGEQILRSMLASKNNYYLPVGFLDDSPIKQKVAIHGVRVLGKISDTAEIIKTIGAEQIIIALPSAGNKIIRNAVDMARKAGVRKIKIAPPVSELIGGKISFGNLRDVEAEDLLNRERIIQDTAQIKSFVEGKVVLITGAAGSIGSELARQTAKFVPSLILLLDQDETGIFNITGELKNFSDKLSIAPIVADITDKEKIKEIFNRYKPQIIFHAAAYKHVPLMEEQPDEAVKNNVFGTAILANAAADFSVEKFIFVSTDKAVNPTSVMGATKRLGEMVCHERNGKNGTKFISVRFGNVLDSRGSVIPTFREQIKRGGPVEVTHPEMQRYFMLISEACLLVMQAGAMGAGGEVFVLDMGKPVKILDLAKEMIRLSGLKEDKDIAIVITGMRPGEKILEEILTAEEGTVATKHQKIFTAKSPEVDSAQLEKEMEVLRGIIASEGEKRQKIISFFRRALPNYRHSSE